MIDIRRHPWGTILGPLDAAISIVVATGQHGDEYFGMIAGTAIHDMLLAWVRGQDYRVAGPSGRETIPRQDLAGVRLMLIQGLNEPGLRTGSRYYRDPETGDLADLNRCWPRGREVVARAWDAISSLPGRIYVVDVHSTWEDRTHDHVPDTHVFAHASCGSLVRAAAPGMHIEPTPDEERGTLEREAVRAGHWAITLELGHETFPGLVGLRFFAALCAEILGGRS